MTSATLRGKTAAAIVYERLRGEILSTELAPGLVLDERRLAERFGVSRSPVREALIKLGAERLVETLANRTSIVAQFDIVSLPAYLVARDFVYRFSARLAAERRSEVDVARIESAMLAGEAAHDLATYVEGNRRFHLAIAEATGSPMLRHWTREALDRGQRVLALVASREAAEGGPHAMGRDDSHQAMFEAIRAEDAEAADRAAARDAKGLADGIALTLGRPALAQLDLGATP
jgi:DNA-binding GntR family transcriptional regulator